MASEGALATAVALYGNGAELGNFKFFVDDLLATDLLKKFTKDRIIVKRTVFRDEIFQAILDQPDSSIKELHIFSHSIGAGLYPGYHDPAANASRNSAFNAAAASLVQIDYTSVLNAEIGAVLTDHLITAPFNKDQAKMKAKFASGARAKLWGCNAGVDNWVYSDPSGASVVTDPDATADYYYWRALNTQNVPKPSISQALADFWGISVYGAKSGAHIEVFHQKHWMTSAQYKAETKHWPGSAQILRLKPDKGSYVEYHTTE
jgi:hypothetical protein